MNATKPVALGLKPSFGFGDRLGCATPGHLDALKSQGGSIKGIFAQQSIREMARTKRVPTEVMSCAAEALAVEDFDDVWGADADHLKSEKDVDYTADAGFIFYTIDPSEHVDQKTDNYDAATLDQKFDGVKSSVPWIEQYRGKTIAVKNGPTLKFDDVTVRRAAVKYGKAIAHALSLAAYIKNAAAKRGQDYEIELSVDETDQPTTLAEHYIIADQCRRAGMKLVSLAPRYIGEFEKGVDYKGDPRKLEQSLKDHAAIARELGPYKLSLHSGSDKLSMYGLFARATQGMFHVKTAGTSYLEALRVAAIHDPALFRKIIDFARQRYDTDKATYHVSATVPGVPAPKDVSDNRKLEQLYLERWEDVAASEPSPPGRGQGEGRITSDGILANDSQTTIRPSPQPSPGGRGGLIGKGFTAPGRQILHCTFGSVLTDATFGPALKAVLEAHPDTYRRVLADHFGKHLAALRSGM